uniref:Uncharacterized protein n=1 Tax=Romanomermis culicivorax TaxID=13658 RepID=A0A915HJ84_ROMCU
MVKTPNKKKVNDEDEGTNCNLDLYDFLASRSVGTRKETKDIKDGRLPQGVDQLSNSIHEQNAVLQEHYKSKVSCEIVLVLQESNQGSRTPTQEVIIADNPITHTPATGSEGTMQGERLMEISKPEGKRQTKLNVLMNIVRIMKERIETLEGKVEKDHFGKEAIELAKKIQSTNKEEEPTSKEPDVEVLSKARSKEDDVAETNTLPALAIYAKASGQGVEEITNQEKFSRVMKEKWRIKQHQLNKQENEEELQRVIGHLYLPFSAERNAIDTRLSNKT